LPRDAEIALACAGGGPKDVFKVLLVLPQPLVKSRGRTTTGGWRNEVLLPQEPEEVGETLGLFGPSAVARAGETVKILLDERLIHLCHRVPLSVKPVSELITVTQRAPNARVSIALFVQSRREVVEVGTQQPTAKLGDHRGLRIELFQHALLLRPNGELEKENRMSRSCGVG